MLDYDSILASNIHDERSNVRKHEIYPDYKYHDRPKKLFLSFSGKFIGPINCEYDEIIDHIRNPIEIIDDDFAEIIDVTEVAIFESLMNIKFSDLNKAKFFFIIGTITSEDDKRSLICIIPGEEKPVVRLSYRSDLKYYQKFQKKISRHVDIIKHKGIYIKVSNLLIYFVKIYYSYKLKTKFVFAGQELVGEGRSKLNLYDCLVPFYENLSLSYQKISKENMRELLILLWKLDYKNLAKTPLSIEIKQDVMLALQYELPKLPNDRRTYATTSKRRTRDKSFNLLACSAPVDDKYCNNNIRDESISQLAGICSRCIEVKELASVWSNFASYPVDQREAAAALLLHNMSWRLLEPRPEIVEISSKEFDIDAVAAEVVIVQTLLLSNCEPPMNAPLQFDNVDDVKIFLEYWSRIVIRSILDQESQMFHYLYADRLVTFSLTEIKKAIAKGTTLMGNRKRKQYCSIPSSGAVSVPFHVSIKLDGGKQKGN